MEGERLLQRLDACGFYQVNPKLREHVGVLVEQAGRLAQAMSGDRGQMSPRDIQRIIFGMNEAAVDIHFQSNSPLFSDEVRHLLSEAFVEAAEDVDAAGQRLLSGDVLITQIANTMKWRAQNILRWCRKQVT